MQEYMLKKTKQRDRAVTKMDKISALGVKTDNEQISKTQYNRKQVL